MDVKKGDSVIYVDCQGNMLNAIVKEVTPKNDKEPQMINLVYITPHGRETINKKGIVHISDRHFRGGAFWYKSGENVQAIIKDCVKTDYT